MYIFIKHLLSNLRKKVVCIETGRDEGGKKWHCGHHNNLFIVLGSFYELTLDNTT